MRPQQTQVRASASMLLLTTLLILLPSTFASPLLSSTSTSSSLSLSNSNITSPSATSENSAMNGEIMIEKRQMSSGSSCDGSEGQWNCLTNQWQRCASGQWSVVMDCAVGTMCTPSGLTYDFAVQFANGAAGGPATSGGTPGPGAKTTHRKSMLAVLGGVSVIIGIVAS
ncbi:hypothetical protein F4804DRAFT_133249 [Jackrogersella minutella]|nr:hypothetical protein F4804DRAFT_133249 [Jackrogersella minutella]